ncbi:putative transcription factor ste11 [Halenospora varia]|nr:putative transcription factor ste11 [Halenospora varia]
MHYEQYSTPGTSPPTPSMDMLRTRSGLGIQRSQQLRPKPEARGRIEKAPKAKKVKREKIKAEKKVAKLEKPLSELTKDWTHVPVADIDTYVNRSAEDRRREVEEGKTPGKVKRPMNSFMLYRKAYQNRTKDWCLQNNHQVVSQVCGDSWPLEPEEVKEQFNEWARIERINHQNAHPGYKFSPTKPGTAKATKRKHSEPLTDDSELSDYDWGNGTTRRTKKLRPSHRADPPQNRPVVYPTTRSAYQYSSRESSIDPSYGAYNKSSYQATNPGRPPPAPYQQNLQNGEYYQQTIRQNPQIAGAQDVILTKTAAPGMHSSYLGLPGGQEFDMMNQYSQQYDNRSTPALEHKIDPSLMSSGQQSTYSDSNFAPHHAEGVYFGDTQHGEQKFHPAIDLVDPHLGDPALAFGELEQHHESLPIHDPHVNVLRGNQEGWHVESLEVGQEFDKWMEGE